jgi:hypothetical protein
LPTSGQIWQVPSIEKVPGGHFVQDSGVLQRLPGGQCLPGGQMYIAVHVTPSMPTKLFGQGVHISDISA